MKTIILTTRPDNTLTGRIYTQRAVMMGENVASVVSEVLREQIKASEFSSRLLFPKPQFVYEILDECLKEVDGEIARIIEIRISRRWN